MATETYFMINYNYDNIISINQTAIRRQFHIYVTLLTIVKVYNDTIQTNILLFNYTEHYTFYKVNAQSPDNGNSISNMQYPDTQIIFLFITNNVIQFHLVYYSDLLHFSVPYLTYAAQTCSNRHFQKTANSFRSRFSTLT